MIDFRLAICTITLALMVTGCDLLGLGEDYEDVVVTDQVDSEKIYEEWPPVDYDLETASIEGDILTLRIEAEICDKGNIHVVTSAIFDESSPVQTGAYISQDDQASCDQVSTHEKSFNLSPLKSAYQKSYSGNRLKINVYNPVDDSVYSTVQYIIE